jgi:GNAT superfamily N-acetyltransferase
MALIPVRENEVAAVVTTLEMRRRPPLRPLPAAPLRLVRWHQPDADKYRALFRRVGAPWLWFSRLVIDEAALLKIIHDPAVQVFAAIDAAGIEVGFLELDFRQNAACEICYFALIPELAGRGLGRWLMAEALTRGWGARTSSASGSTLARSIIRLRSTSTANRGSSRSVGQSRPSSTRASAVTCPPTARLTFPC